MAMDIPPPPSFKPDRSAEKSSQTWKSWKQGFEVYLSARDLDNASGKRKVNLLLHFLGPEGLKLYNTFDFRPAIAANPDENIVAVQAEDKENLQTVLHKFDLHYGKGKMRNLCRQAFLGRKQQPGESVMDFLADLKYKVQLCEYGTAEESILCDLIIDGVREEHTKRDLLELEGEDLSLNNCIKICRRAELMSVQIGKPAEENIALIGSQGYGRDRGHSKYRGSSRRPEPSSHQYTRACDFCCKQHPPRQCPAYNRYCGNCGTKGHFFRSSKCVMHHQTQSNKQGEHSSAGRVYRGRGQTHNHHRGRGRPRDMHVMNSDIDMYEGTTVLNEEYCNMFDQSCNMTDVFTCYVSEPVSCDSMSDEESWLVVMETNGKSLTLKIDTGAKRNLVSRKTLACLDIHNVQPSDLLLKGINATRKSDGKIKLNCSYKGQTEVLEFEVSDSNNCVDLLCKKDSVLFGLISRIDVVSNDSNDLLTMYKDVFDGTIGCIPGEYHIKLNDAAKPVVCAPRPIPAPIRNQVKQELDHLEKSGIIAKVTEPTEWVNPMVCIRKPSGRVRICIDPHNLNKGILREHYPMSSLDDILTRLHGSKYYSVVDANMGFYQIRLSDDSSYYTTFNSPFGRYRHVRLPMGISSAPEIYQRAMHDMFSDLDGVEIVVDDILIHGRTLDEHNVRLQAVLARAREVNLKLNPKKN